MHLRFSTRRRSCARAKLVEALEDRRLFASSVSIADVTRDEGDSGSTTFNFTVVRGGDTGPGGVVTFATQTGTANATDFTARSGGISFAPGEDQKTISIVVKGDTDIEADETFKVVLTGSSTVSVVKGEGIGTIRDDDAPIAPAITVSVQGGSAITDGQPTALDFGSVTEGAAGASKIITVKNTGKANLTLSGLTIPTGYTVTGDLAGTLAPDESDSFTVTLGTATAGTIGGAISFATNVTGKNPFNFPVTGTVGAAGKPEVSVAIGTTAIKDGQQTPVDFGAVSQGASSVSKNIIVKNDGTGNLSLSDLTLPTGFTLVGELPAAIEAGESKSFTITMPGSTLGTFSGAVSFKTNDTSESTFNFPITGTVNVVGAPEISVSLDSVAIFDGQAGIVDFGSVVQGAAGVSRTFTVSNLGTGALTLATPTLPAGYTITESLVQSLGVGESDTFTITSNSSVAGAARGEVSIVTNDTDENPFNFKLTGSVNLPQTPEIAITFDDDATDTIAGIGVQDEDGVELDFGTTLIGEASESRTFTVTNQGTAPLTATLGTLPTGYEIVEPLSESIAAGESDTFTLRIPATAALGRQAGTLSITSNDSDESPFSIAIGGSVVSPVQAGVAKAVFEIAGTPATSGQALDFGARPAGAAAKVFDVVVKNDGEGPLELGQIVLPSGFTISGTAPTSVAAGESGTLKIAFSASSAGTFGGTAIIPTNDPDASAFELALSGIATSGSGSGGEIAVVSVTGKVPTAVVSGDNADSAALTVRVKNNGTTDFNGSLVLAINASKDDKLDAGDGSALFTVTKKARIRPGQTVTLKANTPLTNAPEGDIQLLATTTAGNTVSTMAGPGVTVADPFVNLQSSLSPVPKKPLKFGKKASLSVGLENEGNTATSATPAEYTLIVSTSQSEDDAVYETTASGKISLKPGAKKTQKLNFTIPEGEFAAGSYFMLVKVNAELNESNGDVVGIIPFSIA